MENVTPPPTKKPFLPFLPVPATRATRGAGGERNPFPLFRIWDLLNRLRLVPTPPPPRRHAPASFPPLTFKDPGRFFLWRRFEAKLFFHEPWNEPTR